MCYFVYVDFFPIKFDILKPIIRKVFILITEMFLCPLKFGSQGECHTHLPFILALPIFSGLFPHIAESPEDIPGVA